MDFPPFPPPQQDNNKQFSQTNQNYNPYSPSITPTMNDALTQTMDNGNYHSPLKHDHSHKLDSINEGIRLNKVLVGIISFGLILTGFGIGWGSNNFFSKPGDVEPELVGKWYSSDGEGSLWLKSSGDYLQWDEVRFECVDGSYSVRVSWVNDGFDDCDDGSDENPSLIFENGHDWSNGFGGSNNGDSMEATWYVSKDNNHFCIDVNLENSAGSAEFLECVKYAITGTVLWIAFSSGEDIKCTPYVDLSRNNGPQLDTGGPDIDSEWNNLWNFAYSDYSTKKPDWCSESVLD